MSTPTREQLDELVLSLIGRHPFWRYGQTVFNAALTLDADAANSLRGSDLDPFYDCDRAEDFIEAWLAA